MAELFVGCGGFSYQHWRGQFYPEDLARRHWFTHYGSVFSTVELNVTFYHTPSAATFTRWYEESPPVFRLRPEGKQVHNAPEEAAGGGGAAGSFFSAR